MGTTEIILATVLSIIFIVIGYSWTNLSDKGKAMYVVALIATILIAGFQLSRKTKEDYVAEVNSKIIEINNEKTVSGRIKFCGEGAIFHDVSMIWGDSPELYGIYSKDGKASLNLIIYDIKADPVGVVKDNELKMFDDNNWEYQNDKYGFEIVTRGLRQVLVQVDFTDTVIKYCGFMLTSERGGWFYSPDTSARIIESAAKFKQQINHSIRRLFVYPRESNLGKRETY